METILVQIASYRDWELVNTIESALSQASHPGRLRFAIVNQDEVSNFASLERYMSDPRFKIELQEWREARGVGLARHRTDLMYEGEDFYFQIDAHMRFTAGWDDVLIREWRAIGDAMAILSAYPPAYKYREDGTEEYVASNPNRLVVHDMFMGFIPVFFGSAVPSEAIGQRGSFVAGGMQFGPGEVCRVVPYEERICFIGEEVVHSLRLFDAGYSVYTPISQVVYHLYIRSQNQAESHHFWSDFAEDGELSKVYKEMNDLSYETVRRYLEGRGQVDDVGIRAFENFAGVDFKRGRVHSDTYRMAELPMARSSDWRKVSIAPKKQN